MEYPPLPDLSKFDFTFRPKLKPVLKKDIDEEAPFSRYHEIAYYEMPATIFDDLMYVYCDVKKEKGPGRCTYFFANEYYEQNEGDDLPNGEWLESYAEEFTMSELILYLETYELGTWPRASLCQHLYDCLEDYVSLPINKMPEMEIGSTMYPQLKEFYDVLFEYLRCWLNERGELPELEDFLAAVDNYVDSI